MRSRQFTVYSQQSPVGEEKGRTGRETVELDFNTEGTENTEKLDGESVRDEARGNWRFIEAVG
jgi:hypothetical protein